MEPGEVKSRALFDNDGVCLSCKYFDYKDKETQYMVIKKLGEEAKFQEFEHHKFNGQRIIYKDGCYSPLCAFVQVNI